MNLHSKTLELLTRFVELVNSENSLLFNHNDVVITILKKGGFEIELGAFVFTCSPDMKGNLSNMKSYDLNYHFPDDLDQAAIDFSEIF